MEAHWHDRSAVKIARAQALALAVLAASGLGVLYVYPPAAARWYPRCPFLALTGWKCAGCGGLRAVHALLHGRVAEAIGYNGFLVTLLPAFAAFSLWHLYSVLRWGRWRAASPLVPALWVMSAAAAVFGVLRNVTS